MRATALRLTVALGCAFAAPSLVGAQIAAPQPAPLADAAMEAQRNAFLALSEADRKAAQESLVWLGFYNGVVDGGFGKRTRDAILAW